MPNGFAVLVKKIVTSGGLHEASARRFAASTCSAKQMFHVLDGAADICLDERDGVCAVCWQHVAINKSLR